METNDDQWRKGSLGFLPITAESGRTESHFPPLHPSACMASFWVPLTYVSSTEVPVKQQNKLRVMFWRPLECSIQYMMQVQFFQNCAQCYSWKGCATVDTASLSKAMEWTLWHSQAITSMQAEPEEPGWMHRTGETQGLIVDLALIRPGAASMGDPMKGLLFCSEEDCVLTSLLMLQNQDTCRIPKRPKVILIWFISLGLLYFYLKYLREIYFMLFPSYCKYSVDKGDACN